MRKYISASDDIETKDILYSLTGILPAALEQFKNKFRAEYSGDPLNDANNFAKYLNQNIRYKEDGLNEQVIQTPEALFASKSGDCKSFALALACYLTAGGYVNGFRFVSYKKGGDFTHVYNFILDENQNIHTFDSCLSEPRAEAPYVKKRDMQVSIIGSTPFAHDRGSKIGSLNTVFMGPVRIAFLSLIRLNYRGNATGLDYIRQNSPNLINAFWSSLGGNQAKLNAAINAGKAKQPLLGSGDLNDRAEISAAWEQMASQNMISELIANAVLQGFVAPFNPLNLSDPNQFSQTFVALNEFYNRLGESIFDTSIPWQPVTQGGQTFDQPVVTRGDNVLTPPPSIPVGGDRSKIADGGATAATVAGIVAVAGPILLLLPDLLRSAGVPEGDLLNALDNLGGNFNGLTGGATDPSTNNVNTSPEGMSFESLLPWLAGGGLLLYFLMRKNRR